MRPQISRAVLGSILGFIVGVIIVTLLRVAFNFTPYWNSGLSLVLGTFLAVFGVVWGVGGFNPRMSAHPDDSKQPLSIDEQAELSGWRGVLSNSTWQVWFAVLVMMVVFIVIALVPGWGISITRVAEGSVKGFGTITIPLFGEEVGVSQSLLLFAWMAFTMLSLVITGAIIAGIFVALNRGVKNANAAEPQPAGAPRENVNPLMRSVGNFAGVLADRIAPAEDKETTAVVARED